MRNYIFADIRRIAWKQSFLAVLGAYMGLFLLMMFLYFNPTFTAEAYTAKTKTFLSFFPLFLGVLVFLAVYYDDFKSKSMQVAIGYGISRYRVVLAKFVESILLLLTAGLAMGLVIFVLPVLLGLPLNAIQRTELVCSIFAEGMRALGYISLSAVPAFYAQNAVGGTVLCVLLSSRTVMILLTMILGQDFLVQVFGDLTQYLFTAQLYSIRSAFVEHGTVGMALIWTTAAYILFPTMLSAFRFYKRELEF